LGSRGIYPLQIRFRGAACAAVALSLIRELGPVLTAIMIVGGRVSDCCGDRHNEDIRADDALDTLDIDPVRFLVSPGSLPP
jgi:phospholipid/cholesterol/gamma-HCH transport system permease protein